MSDEQPRDENGRFASTGGGASRGKVMKAWAANHGSASDALRRASPGGGFASRERAQSMLTEMTKAGTRKLTLLKDGHTGQTHVVGIKDASRLTKEHGDRFLHDHAGAFEAIKKAR